MSTEFNYVVKLDTTSVMGSLAEVRSQVGMAFGGMGGGASGGMMRGLERSVGSMFGQTHTDPAMAYDPNYGQIFATTSRAQEDAVSRYGLAAAEAMRPPGVSAYEYAMGAHGNAIDRQQGARREASLAAQSTFFSGAFGLGAGEVAFGAGAAVGGKIGASIGTRLLGAGGAGAGKFLGAMGLGIAAFGMAEEYVGGRIRDHYAEVSQISGITNELGDIVGGGRGLSREDQYRTGIAAREAAKDINMDVQSMGAIASLGRATGMLPGTTDPGKLREQLGDLAKAVDEGASALHTSLGNAAMVIRSASKQGITGEEAILRAGAAGGAEQYLANQARYEAFGNQGGQFAMQQRLTHKQGFQMFTGALGQAAGAAGAMGSEAMQILGGRYGAASMIAAGQIGAATSPMGDMQLMAAAGGGALGGMMDLPGQAMAAMSQGGDFLSNIGKFQVHKDELRRGIGAQGIRTMARQQLISGGEMMRQFMPGMDESEAQRLFAQNTMGMDPTQAQAYVAGVNRTGGGGGGGGGGGEAYARRLDTYQNMQMHRAGLGAIKNFNPKEAEDYSDGYGFGMGYAMEFGMTGAMMGSGAGGIGALPGGLIGAGAGLVVGNAKAAYNFASDLISGPGLLNSAQEKADYYNLEEAKNYDRKIANFKERYGAVDLNMDVAARISRAPLRRNQIDISDGMSPMAAARYGGTLAMMGAESVEAGPGTVTYDGKSYRIDEVRRLTREMNKPIKFTEEAREAARMVGINASPEVIQARKTFREETWHLKNKDYRFLNKHELNEGEPSEEARANAMKQAMRTSELRRRQAAMILLKASGNDRLRSDFEEGTDPRREAMSVAYLAAGMEDNIPSFNLKEEQDITLAAGLSGRQGKQARAWRNYLGMHLPLRDLGPGEASDSQFIEDLEGRADWRKAQLRKGGPDYDSMRKIARSQVLKTGSAIDTDAFVGNLKNNTPQSTRSKVRSILGDLTGDEQFKEIDFETETAKLRQNMLDAGERPGDPLGGKRSPGAPAPLSRSIGFGEQESALTTINKTLLHTHNMMKSLDKKISAMPAATNDAAPGKKKTGVKGL